MEKKERCRSAHSGDEFAKSRVFVIDESTEIIFKTSSEKDNENLRD